MTDQKKLARQWAESRGQFENRSERERAAAEFILANTESETMMGREWVHSEHHMAGADWEGDIPVVMIDPASGRSTFVFTVEEEDVHEVADKDLTPNGKRYKLVEDTTPDHPEVLETLEDYVNAPEGTIIAKPGDHPWIKEDRMWRSPLGWDSSHSLALSWESARTVLRWGEGLRSMSQHPDTIGTIEHDGKVYEIDWPHDLFDPSKRHGHGVIYLNGRLVAEFVKPGFGTFTSAKQVMQTAQDFINAEGLDK